MAQTSNATLAATASLPDIDITYRLAKSREELEQAFELVWRNYTEVGLQQTDETGLRLTKYHLLPDSKVFIAVAQCECQDAGGTVTEERVIGTLTVVLDGCLGLPAEEVCRKEIVSMRQHGERLAEIIALASDQEGTDNRVVLKLFRLAYEHCRRNGMSRILASLTERHIGFYRRFLGFHPLGTLKEYKMANGIPVQAHQINIKDTCHLIERRSSSLHADVNWRLFWEHYSEEVLLEATSAYPWDHGKLQYFLSQCDYLLQQIDISDAFALSLEYKRFDCDLSLTVARHLSNTYAYPANHLLCSPLS